MICRMKRRRACSSSSWRASGVSSSASRSAARCSCLTSASARSPSSLRIAGVAGALGGQAIEARRVLLHFARARAHRVDAERADLPDRLARDVAANVLAANERNVLAELRDEEIDEAPAVLVLLGRHVREDLGAGGIVLAQAVGEVGVDAPVLLLVGDRQREHLALGEVVEIAHAPKLLEAVGRDARRRRRRATREPAPAEALIRMILKSARRAGQPRGLRLRRSACSTARRLLRIARIRAARDERFPHSIKFSRVVVKVGSSLLVDARARRVEAGMARRAGRRYRGAAQARRRRAGRLLRRDRARPHVAGLPQGRAEARGQPGRGGDRPDRARARLVAGAAQPRHRRRPGAADAAATPRSGAAISTRAKRWGGSRRCARCPSSTRTTPSPPAKSATATTTGSPRASPPWRAPICLILLSDVAGLYDAPPKENPKAQADPASSSASRRQIEAMAGGAASETFARRHAHQDRGRAHRHRRRRPHGDRRRARRASDRAHRRRAAPCTWFLTPSNPVTARKVWIGGTLELKGVDHDRRRRRAGRWRAARACCRPGSRASRACSRAAIASPSATSTAPRSAAA